MTVEVSTTDPRSLKALAVLATADRWTKGHRKSDGRSFFVIPGSRGHTYYTDQSACTCPDVRERGSVCKHQLAVRLWNLQQGAQVAVAAPSAPPQRPCTRCGGQVRPESIYATCDTCTERFGLWL